MGRGQSERPTEREEVRGKGGGGGGTEGGRKDEEERGEWEGGGGGVVSIKNDPFFFTLASWDGT
jgi:hypothetical protein